MSQTISHIKHNQQRQEMLDKIATKMPVPPASRIYDIGLQYLLLFSERLVEQDESIQIVLKALYS